jgi:hypothetical protein
MGHPINHSTQRGFNNPPICSLNGRLFLSCVAWLAFPLRQSLAVGVAIVVALIASISVPPLLPSVAVGVGHFTHIASVGRVAAFGESLRFVRPVPASIAVGVGIARDDPRALAYVGSAGVPRANNTPSTVIPHRGKVTDDPVNSSSHKRR